MARLILAIAAAAALGLQGLGTPACAGAADPSPAPRLKELVSVSSDIVRIGDLVDNAGAAADVPVFRAPDLGQTGAVSVTRIADALRPYDVAGLQTGGLREVVVTRLSRAVTGRDITESIAHAFAGQYGLGDADNISIVLDRDIRILHLEPTASADLVASRSYLDPRTGRFDITFEVPGSLQSHRAPLRFTGTATATVETAALIRTVRPGEIIKASDVALERRPKNEVRGEGLALSQAIGLAAKSQIRAGSILRPDDLARPLIVQRNEAVTIAYQVPGISLTVRGKATEAAALGDVVSVLNIQTNRTIQATVTGPGRVAIAVATPVLAQAGAPAADPSASSPTQ